VKERCRDLVCLLPQEGHSRAVTEEQALVRGQIFGTLTVDHSFQSREQEIAIIKK
jgi:hypothetical protein